MNKWKDIKEKRLGPEATERVDTRVNKTLGVEPKLERRETEIWKTAMFFGKVALIDAFCLIWTAMLFG